MDIAQVKVLLTIGEVLSHYNLKPDRSGRLRCPFHDDSTPSMQVYPDTNTVFCFSSNCEQSGKPLDVVDMIRLLEGVDTAAALQKAQSLVGLSRPSGNEKTQKPPMNKENSGGPKTEQGPPCQLFWELCRSPEKKQ